MGHYVYAIGKEPQGPLKIGYTQDIGTRLAKLQIGNHEELKVYCLGRVTHQKIVNPLTAKKAEGAIHRTLKDKRIRGEWFAVSADELTECVTAIGFAGGRLAWEKRC